MRTAFEVATAIQEVIWRQELKRPTRFRMSEKSLRYIAGRLTPARIVEIANALEILGWGLHPLSEDRGGFGLVKISTLDGAPFIGFAGEYDN